ncbi:MAG: MerC domain-containing protein [Planctomycetes bacterium]|nr:MerC domain-containing protein [Planctomycetota bacterium]
MNQPSSKHKRMGRWQGFLATVPSIGVSLLPAGLCPVCWPAYAGLAGSLGFGALLETKWLFPLTAAFLLLAVGALGFRARTRRGYGPFVMGISASVVVLLGKFLFESNAMMYGGIGLLITTSVWNVWPERKYRKEMKACCQEPNKE